MEFFKRLSELIDGYDLQIVLQKTRDTLSVSIFPKIKEAEKDKDKLSKIKPLVLSGTPEELDNGFFDAIEQPLAKTNGLFTNIAEFVEQIQEVKDGIEKDAKKEAEKKTGAIAKKVVKKTEKEKPKTPADNADILISEATRDFKEKNYEAALHKLVEAKRLAPKGPNLSDKIMDCKVKLKAQQEDEKDQKAEQKEEKTKQEKFDKDNQAELDQEVESQGLDQSESEEQVDSGSNENVEPKENEDDW